jgi:hypothetical protein
VKLCVKFPDKPGKRLAGPRTDWLAGCHGKKSHNERRPFSDTTKFWLKLLSEFSATGYVDKTNALFCAVFGYFCDVSSVNVNLNSNHSYYN